MRTGCMWDTCETHMEHTRDAFMLHIPDASEMHAGRVWQDVLIKLQQDFCNCHALFCQTWNASRMCAGHIQNACRMRLEHVQDTST